MMFKKKSKIIIYKTIYIFFMPFSSFAHWYLNTECRSVCLALSTYSQVRTTIFYNVTIGCLPFGVLCHNQVSSIRASISGLIYMSFVYIQIKSPCHPPIPPYVLRAESFFGSERSLPSRHPPQAASAHPGSEAARFPNSPHRSRPKAHPP